MTLTIGSELAASEVGGAEAVRAADPAKVASEMRSMRGADITSGLIRPRPGVLSRDAREDWAWRRTGTRSAIAPAQVSSADLAADDHSISRRVASSNAEIIETSQSARSIRVR